MLLIWMAPAGLAVFVRRRAEAGSAGLVIAYLTSLWLLHWPAAAIYVIPSYSNFDPVVVEDGFRQSIYAVVGFTLGVVGVAPFLAGLLPVVSRGGEKRVPEARLAVVYVVIGLVAYLLLLVVVGQVPTLTALVAAVWNFVVVGLGLGCWHAWRRRRRFALLLWLAAAAGLPFLTILSAGFLGYGISALLAVLALLASSVRWRPRVIAVGLLLIYLGFSFYVTYMRDRREIRAVVWGGEGAGARVEQLYGTLSTLEWFDPSNAEHLLRIDERLNQNFLVGMAVSGVESGAQQLAWGETLWQAIIALIPRVLWPEKPVVAGSMGLVSVYTGIRFAEGTSVGLGQVLEFYINFGALGIFLGFVILGTVIALVDTAAALRLVQGDWQAFALWYLVGIALLQAGGSLVEVTSSAGAAIVVAMLVNRYLLPRLRGARASSRVSGSRGLLERRARQASRV